MKPNMDSIQFESRNELEELMRVISEYVKANPKEKSNATLKEFYGTLDIIHMSW